MSKDKAMDELREIIRKQKQYKADIEQNHEKADQILCDYLTSLGHENLVKLYLEVEKWYA